MELGDFQDSYELNICKDYRNHINQSALSSPVEKRGDHLENKFSGETFVYSGVSTNDKILNCYDKKFLRASFYY